MWELLGLIYSIYTIILSELKKNNLTQLKSNYFSSTISCGLARTTNNKWVLKNITQNVPQICHKWSALGCHIYRPVGWYSDTLKRCQQEVENNNFLWNNIHLPKTFRIISTKKFLYSTQDKVSRKNYMMHKADSFFVSTHIYMHNKNTFKPQIFNTNWNRN